MTINSRQYEETHWMQKDIDRASDRVWLFVFTRWFYLWYLGSDGLLPDSDEGASRSFVIELISIIPIVIGLLIVLKEYH